MILSAQTLWDLAAILGAATASGFTLLRRHMLGAGIPAFHTAHPAVQGVLAFQAVMTGGVAVSIASGAHHASDVETLLLVVSGVVSFTMAFNLDRTGRRPAPRATATNGAAVKPEPPSMDPRSFAERREPPRPPQ